jgi:hypothetical protein
MRGKRDYSNVGALFIYLVLSFLFFGRGLVGHLSDSYIGTGTDPGAFIFFLEWWKYVFSHHVNPFITHLQWAPTGTNLAWTAFIPLFGISAIPFTAALGPVASYNVLMLLCPALAAWAAFSLCRYLCTSRLPAFIGGYIFGFSPYILAHLTAHLNLVLIFTLPWMVQVTLLRLSDKIKVVPYIVLLSLLLIVQFLCFPELVATATIFGAGTIGFVWLTTPLWRGRLQALLPPALCAYVATAIIVSPYLYYFFAFGQPAFPGRLASFYSVHPSNFLIPLTTNLLGTIPLARKLSSGNIYETGAYIALPMLLIVASFARSRWQDWGARLLVILLGVVSVASLGPTLQIWKNVTIPMPWSVPSHLPLMGKVLPTRFSVYAFLILGIILSLWLSDGSIRKTARVAGACAVVLFTLPNLNSSYWVTQVDIPAFFRNGLYSRYLSPGENVLILPYSIKGNSDIWQAASEFYFRMAGGYLGPPLVPPQFQRYLPLINDFYYQADFPFSGDLLKAFLVQNRVGAVIVADRAPHLWTSSRSRVTFPELVNFDQEQKDSIRSLFGTLGVPPTQDGGVSLYRVPLETLEAHKDVDLSELETRIATAQMDTLTVAAQKYLSSGRPASNLNLVEAQRLRLLPPHWVVLDPSGGTQNSLVLKVTNDGNVLVGVVGSREVIQGLAGKYRPKAKKVEIAALAQIAAFAEHVGWILLVEYNRAQLAPTVVRDHRTTEITDK